MEDFYGSCIQVLDSQVFKLESNEAKWSAVQAVHRVFQTIYNSEGIEQIERILSQKVQLPVINSKNIEDFAMGLEECP